MKQRKKKLLFDTYGGKGAHGGGAFTAESFKKK
jgi:S-adenosylmethionine synthetase